MVEGKMGETKVGATAKIRGEEILARCLEREGVKSFFFMMGSPTSGTAGASMELGMRGSP